MDTLADIYKELNSQDVNIGRLKDLFKIVESSNFVGWKQKYIKSLKKKESKNKKRLQNKFVKAQNYKRGVVLAKLVEEWSQFKDKEAEDYKLDIIKKRQQTNKEDAVKRTLYNNKLKLIVKLEKLRKHRLFKSNLQDNFDLQSHARQLYESTHKNEVIVPIQPQIDVNIESMTSSNEEENIINFYSQAFENLDKLIHIRRSWDIYIVKEGGQRIPQYLPSEFPLLNHSNWLHWLQPKP